MRIYPISTAAPSDSRPASVGQITFHARGEVDSDGVHVIYLQLGGFESPLGFGYTEEQVYKSALERLTGSVAKRVRV